MGTTTSYRPKHPTFDDVWSKNERLAWMLACRLASLTGLRPDDLVGSVVLILNDSLYSYDPSKGKISTYLYRSVYTNLHRRFLNSEPNTTIRQSRLVPKSGLTRSVNCESLSDARREYVDGGSSLREWKEKTRMHGMHEVTAHFDGQQEFWDYVKRQLLPEDYAIVEEHYLQGKKLREVAEKRSITKNAICQKIQRIRLRLKKILEQLVEG